MSVWRSRITRTVGCVCLAVGSLMAGVQAGEGDADLKSGRPEACDGGFGKPEFELSLDYMSKYVSRGVMINRDSVFAPEFSMCWGGVKAEVVGYGDVTGYSGRRSQFEEADYALSYSHTLWDVVTLEGGIIWYHFPGATADTREWFGSVVFDKLPLSPAVTVYYDDVEANGAYVNPTLEQEFKLTEHFALTATAGLGWGSENGNKFNMGSHHAGFVDATAKLELDYSPVDWLSMGPYLAASEILDGRLHDEVDAARDQHSDQYWGGFHVGVKF